MTSDELLRMSPLVDLCRPYSQGRSLTQFLMRRDVHINELSSRFNLFRMSSPVEL